MRLSLNGTQVGFEIKDPAPASASFEADRLGVQESEDGFVDIIADQLDSAGQVSGRVHARATSDIFLTFARQVQTELTGNLEAWWKRQETAGMAMKGLPPTDLGSRVVGQTSKIRYQLARITHMGFEVEMVFQSFSIGDMTDKLQVLKEAGSGEEDVCLLPAFRVTSTTLAMRPILEACRKIVEQNK